MPGPYEYEAAAAAETMPSAVRDLHRAGLVRPGDPDHLVRDQIMAALTEACAAAGITLGSFDRRILLWLSGWEPETAQVMVDLISRAHAAGLAAPRATPPPPPWQAPDPAGTEAVAS